MVEEIAFENGTISNFQGIDLDPGSGHTAHHRASLIDVYTYTPNFIKIEKTRTYGRTDGRISETHFIRLTQKSLTKNLTVNSCSTQS